MQVIKKELNSQDMPQAQTLEQAFAKFTEASERLQTKYELLSHEAGELREKLAQKEIEVKRQERLATLGKTAAALAHEIRNPLGAITLYASLLKGDLSESPDSFELVQHIEKSAERLNQVVSNILRFTKTTNPRFAPVRIHAILEQSVSEFKSQYPGIECMLHEAKNSYIFGCSLSLEQVFRNLLFNSAQAMGEEGRIVITEEELENEFVISFRDSGPGIDKEILPVLFEPFVTSKNQGTGLGLAIVQQIIAQHSGSVEARNLTTGGAEFKITLPRAVQSNKSGKGDSQ